MINNIPVRFVIVLVTLGLVVSPVAAAAPTTSTAAPACAGACVDDPKTGPGERLGQGSGDRLATEAPGLGQSDAFLKAKKAFLQAKKAFGQGSGDRLAKDGPGLGQSDEFLQAKKAFLKAKKAFVTNPDNMAPEWVVPGGGVAYDGSPPVAVMPGDRVDVGDISVMPGDNVRIGETVVTDSDNMAPGQGAEPSDPSVKSD